MTELRSAIHPSNWEERASRSLWGGKGAASIHFEKCAGTKPAQTGEQGTGTLCPREQTWENACDALQSECESTRPLKLRTLFHTGASGDSSPSRAFPRRGIKDPSCTFPRRGMRWLLAPRGPHFTLNEWESGVLCTWQPLMWGWYRGNERVSSTHGSRWFLGWYQWMRVSSTHGRPLLGGWYRVNERVSSTHSSRWLLYWYQWMRECLLHTADRSWGAGIVWIREQCLTHFGHRNEQQDIKSLKKYSKGLKMFHLSD